MQFIQYLRGYTFILYTHNHKHHYSAVSCELPHATFHKCASLPLCYTFGSNDSKAISENMKCPTTSLRNMQNVKSSSHRKAGNYKNFSIIQENIGSLAALCPSNGHTTSARRRHSLTISASSLLCTISIISNLRTADTWRWTRIVFRRLTVIGGWLIQWKYYFC